MEFDITLKRNDFFVFLLEQAYTPSTIRITRYVSALAMLGALAVVVLQDWKQGGALVVLAAAFLCWNPLLLYGRAGKMARAAKPVSKVHYALDSTGFVIHTPKGRPRRVQWAELYGAAYGAKQIVLYKDLEHAYILPRGQLADPDGLEKWLRGRTKEVAGKSAA